MGNQNSSNRPTTNNYYPPHVPAPRSPNRNKFTISKKIYTQLDRDFHTGVECTKAQVAQEEIDKYNPHLQNRNGQAKSWLGNTYYNVAEKRQEEQIDLAKNISKGMQNEDGKWWYDASSDEEDDFQPRIPIPDPMRNNQENFVFEEPSAPDMEPHYPKPSAPAKPIEIQHKDNPTEIPELQCIVCLDNKKCMSLNPCTHTCVCFGCSKKIKECPLCRKKVENKKHVYI